MFFLFKVSIELEKLPFIASKLKEITLYTRPEHPLSKTLKETLESEGIKFIEKNIDDTFPHLEKLGKSATSLFLLAIRCIKIYSLI